MRNCARLPGFARKPKESQRECGCSSGAGGAENNLWRAMGADSRTLSVCGLTPIAYPTSAGVAIRFANSCNRYSFPPASRTWIKGAGNRGADRASRAASALRV
jgi:hypothetical protein